LVLDELVHGPLGRLQRLFPAVVPSFWAASSAILPWRRSPTLLDLLQRGAATAVICVMPIPVLLMVAGLIQAIIGPR
jgi:hypothetical protein